MTEISKLLQKVFKVLFRKFTYSKFFAKERHPVTVHHTAHFFTVVIADRLFMRTLILNIFRLLRSPEVSKEFTKLNRAVRIQRLINFLSNIFRQKPGICKGVFLVNHNNLFLRSWFFNRSRFYRFSFYYRSRSNTLNRSWSSFKSKLRAKLFIKSLSFVKSQTIQEVFKIKGRIIIRFSFLFGRSTVRIPGHRKLQGFIIVFGMSALVISSGSCFLIRKRNDVITISVESKIIRSHKNSCPRHHKLLIQNNAFFLH